MTNEPGLSPSELLKQIFDKDSNQDPEWRLTPETRMWVARQAQAQKDKGWNR